MSFPPCSVARKRYCTNSTLCIGEDDDTDDLRDEEAESRSSEADLAPRLKVGGATTLLGGATPLLLGGAPATPLLYLSSS